MTYIDYLNKFNQWLETNPLPASSQLMYFKLLNIFNRAGWPEEVGVDNLRFQMMLDGAAKTTVVRARDKLVETGFITYKKGRKGFPNRYALNVIESINDTENATKNKMLSTYATVSATENATVSATENATHIKTKTKNKTKTDSLVESNDSTCRADAQRVMDSWNSLGISQVTKIVPGTNRYGWLRKRIRDYGVDEILRAIENVRDSDFLMGRTNKPFTITFDWFIRPNNFAKILSGNYNMDGSAGKDTAKKSEDVSWMKKYIDQRGAR